MNLSESINRFGINVISDLLADKKEALEAFPNTILSPLGLFFVLAMAYEGAQGSTKDEFAGILGNTGTLPASFTDDIAGLLPPLSQHPQGIKLVVANAIWTKLGTSLLPDFRERCEDRYRAIVESLDFSSPEAAKTINAWVNEITRGKVDQIMEKIPGNAVLYLINALYFKGIWKKPFDAQETITEEFTCLNGETRQVPMMNQSGTYAYAQTEEYQALAVPYVADAASLLFYLPAFDGTDMRKSLLSFQEKTVNMDWDNVLTQFHRREGKISMPRFTVNANLNMKASLQRLGLNRPFAQQTADFGAMVPQPSDLFISDVIHKTCFEVNEEGSEAAAVSKATLVTKSAMLRFSFVLNRPFFCVLLDHSTNTALFMGWVVDPGQG